MAVHDRWRLWQDALALLAHDSQAVRVGAVYALRTLCEHQDLVQPTVDVLRAAVAEWEVHPFGDPSAVDAARALLADLTDNPR